MRRRERIGIVKRRNALWERQSVLYVPRGVFEGEAVLVDLNEYGRTFPAASGREALTKCGWHSAGVLKENGLITTRDVEHVGGMWFTRKATGHQPVGHLPYPGRVR